MLDKGQGYSQVELGQRIFYRLLCGACLKGERVPTPWQTIVSHILAAHPEIQVFAEPKPLPEEDWAHVLRTAQLGLPGSPGEEFLRKREITLRVASDYGVGYLASDQWHEKSKHGWLVFPASNPDGKLLNLHAGAVHAIPRYGNIRHWSKVHNQCGGLLGGPLLHSSHIRTAFDKKPLAIICDEPIDALRLCRPEWGKYPMAAFNEFRIFWPWMESVGQIFLCSRTGGWGRSARSCVAFGIRTRKIDLSRGVDWPVEWDLREKAGPHSLW